MPTPLSLADRMRQWRNWAGLTMADVAAKVGVSKSAVTLWEKGRTSPTHNNVGKFCKSIGITKQQFEGDVPSGTQSSRKAAQSC